jgi:hypothetical protein
VVRKKGMERFEHDERCEILGRYNSYDSFL